MGLQERRGKTEEIIKNLKEFGITIETVGIQFMYEIILWDIHNQRHLN